MNKILVQLEIEIIPLNIQNPLIIKQVLQESWKITKKKVFEIVVSLNYLRIQ